jgi:hypothetical protein
MVARAAAAACFISAVLAGPLVLGMSSNGAIRGKEFDNSFEDNALADLGVSKLRRRHLQTRGIQLAFIKDEAFQEATPDVPTTNVMELEAVEGEAPSHRYFNMLLGEQDVAQGGGNTEQIQNIRDSIYLTTMKIGGETFKLVIDTGSSDTWVAKTGFQCVSVRTKQNTPNASCRIARTYNATQTYSVVANQHFNISYADGEYLNGEMAKDSVQFGGITVKNQQFGLVTLAAWNGDSISSGLTGFGYPSVTRAFAGTGAKGDRKGANVPYDPVFTSMWKQKLVAPYFSVALNRANEPAGQIALGGLPSGNIKYQNNWAKVPMQHLFVGAKQSKDYQLYVVESAGWDITSPKGVIATSVANTKAKVVLDTGTTLSYLPPAIASAINKAYDPPATQVGGQWTVKCNAKTPKVAMKLGGKNLWFDGKDMILKASPTICLSGIQGTKSALAPSILGGVFLKNVVAVFDIGAAEIRLANRVR